MWQSGLQRSGKLPLQEMDHALAVGGQVSIDQSVELSQENFLKHTAIKTLSLHE